MDTEIELKFLVSPELITRLPTLLAAYKISQYDQRNLSNTYFDTPNLALGKLKAGLRIRSKNGKLEQTVKLAGSQVGGLHQRPEYNIDLTVAEPDLSQFPIHIWPVDFPLAQVQADLQPLFSTDFVRERWVVKFQHTDIELALDAGEVRVGEKHGVGTLLDPIQELELELLSGKVSELFAFAEQLLSEGGLRLSAVSKAQRGYQLAGFAPSAQLQSLTLLSETVQPATAEQDHRSLLSILGQGVEHWQHHEQGWLSKLDKKSEAKAEQTADWLTQIRTGVAVVEQSLRSLNESTPDLALSAWLNELTWLQTQLVEGSVSAALFYSARYGRLLLQLTHYLYVQGRH